jgi:hypothetical protein
VLPDHSIFRTSLCLSAQDVATSKQHKSVSAADVLRALEAIDFGDMVDGLQVDLQGTLAPSHNPANIDEVPVQHSARLKS